MEIVGIFIAVVAALSVLFHARIRQLSLTTAILWAAGTFFFLIIILPVYLLIHGPEPKKQDGEA